MPGAAPSLARLFEPRSIAVVGASAAEDKAGYQILKALAPFPGAIWPINPRGGEILGKPVFRALADVPGPIDLVALVLPAEHSAGVLREAAAVGAGAAFMVSGGFGETGPAGRALQDEVLAICREGGIRLLGPNTSGFLRPSCGLYCTFLPAAGEIGAGPIGILAQSGGINLTLALMAHNEGLGVGLAAGLGNAADVGLADAIAYLAADAETRAIVVHLEGLADGRRVFDAVRAATAAKPVIALPVGRTDLGGFAVSHTGTLMGSFALTRAALRQAGAVVVDTLDDALDAAHALSLVRLGPRRDPGIGVLTAQAGPGLLMCDTLGAAGIRTPDLADATVARIAMLLPPLTYMRNPVDTGRPSETYGEVLETIAADPAVDAVLAYALIEDATLDLAAALRRARKARPEPLVFGTAGVPDRVESVVGAARAAGIPAFAAPDRAARAMRAVVEDARAAARATRAVEAVPAGETLSPGPLDEDAAKSLIESCGIAVPRRFACASRAEAEAAFRALGGRAAVKVLDAAIAHKTEAGGVHLGIESAAALGRALDAIDAIPGPAVGRRYLVESMAPAGLELIMGARNDPSFGPTVLLGIGGVAAEALGDVQLRLAPIEAADAEEMMAGLAARALLEGFRGQPAPDRAAIADALVRLARLIAAHPEIREIDLNPVRAYPTGVLALDALVVF